METLLSTEAVAQLKRLRVPRLACGREEAAEALGISLDSFERYVQPHIRMVPRGQVEDRPDPRARALARRARDKHVRALAAAGPGPAKETRVNGPQGRGNHAAA